MKLSYEIKTAILVLSGIVLFIIGFSYLKSNVSEPGALIGFAGPRVVKDTTGQDLPEGFQRSEFLLDNGFIDFISHRNDLKKNINLLRQN